MKIIKYLSLILILTVISCSSNFSKKIEKKHPFSRPDKDDLFILTLSGKEIDKANLNFKIISYDGKTIYDKSFESDDLVGFGPVPKSLIPLTQKEKNDFIIKRFNGFFQEENFKKPAILSNAQIDPYYYSDPKIWNTIKADKTAIGFHYWLNKRIKEKNIYNISTYGGIIAYEKKTNKVVMYLELGKK